MTKYIVATLIILIGIAHIFLWRSDMDTTLKLTFTAINVTGWTIILAPIFFVNRWIKTIEARNARSKTRDKDVVT